MRGSVMVMVIVMAMVMVVLRGVCLPLLTVVLHCIGRGGCREGVAYLEERQSIRTAWGVGVTTYAHPPTHAPPSHPIIPSPPREARVLVLVQGVLYS